jgi:putative membrane protein
MTSVHDAHDEAVKLFDAYAKDGDNASLKHAQKTLPVIQEHLTEAKKLRQ